MPTHFGDSEQSVDVPVKDIRPGVLLGGSTFNKSAHVIVQQIHPTQDQRWLRIIAWHAESGSMVTGLFPEGMLLDCWGSL